MELFASTPLARRRVNAQTYIKLVTEHFDCTGLERIQGWSVLRFKSQAGGTRALFLFCFPLTPPRAERERFWAALVIERATPDSLPWEGVAPRPARVVSKSQPGSRPGHRGALFRTAFTSRFFNAQPFRAHSQSTTKYSARVDKADGTVGKCFTSLEDLDGKATDRTHLRRVELINKHRREGLADQLARTFHGNRALTGSAGGK